MKIKTNYLIYLILFLILSCDKKETDRYEILNLVTKEYIYPRCKFPEKIDIKNLSTKDFDNYIKYYQDSLIKSKTLNYYIEENLAEFDTIPNENIIGFEKFTNQKIDFKKLNNIPVGNRLEKVPSYKAFENLPKNFIGIYQFSDISYSKENTTASIIMVSNNGAECFVGILITLKKINNFWKIYQEKWLWIT